MDNSLYIELLKKTLTDFHHIGQAEYKPLYVDRKKLSHNIFSQVDKILRKKNYAICKVVRHTAMDRMEGKDWPAYADTMIGIRRLENLQYCIESVLKDNIAGDMIETGVWRGGAVIFMKALLKANHINNRIVWVADSFEGLPKPNEEKYKADAGDQHFTVSELAISMETVQNNFRKYDLLDENVKFLKGWFKDTLPVAPINQLAVLRLDGDMYESTMDALVNLYPKLAVGGFIIIDDWGAVKGCQQAIIDYRTKHNIKEEIKPIDWAGVYWRRERKD